VIYPATDLARGWLSVGHASSKDKDIPALNRTLSLEQYTTGLRITATDSYMILTTFVPAVDYDHRDEPGPDEVPDAHAVASDAEGRGAGFMSFLVKLAGDYAKLHREMPHVVVRLNVRNMTVGGVGGAQLPGLSPKMVTLEAADLERVDLATYEGQYPPWQGVIEAARTGAEPTDRIALHPERVAALAKVAKVHETGLVGWTFGGEDRPARVDIINSAPYVHGAVMPVRWDLYRNAPRVENPEAPPEAEADDDVDGDVDGADFPPMPDTSGDDPAA
jgi:hypothetical protein